MPFSVTDVLTKAKKVADSSDRLAADRESREVAAVERTGPAGVDPRAAYTGGALEANTEYGDKTRHGKTYASTHASPLQSQSDQLGIGIGYANGAPTGIQQQGN